MDCFSNKCLLIILIISFFVSIPIVIIWDSENSKNQISGTCCISDCIERWGENGKDIYATLCLCQLNETNQIWYHVNNSECSTNSFTRYVTASDCVSKPTTKCYYDKTDNRVIGVEDPVDVSMFFFILLWGAISSAILYIICTFSIIYECFK
jgi:hypothetical protein